MIAGHNHTIGWNKVHITQLYNCISIPNDESSLRVHPQTILEKKLPLGENRLLVMLTNSKKPPEKL